MRQSPIFRLFDFLCALVALAPAVVALAALSGIGHRAFDLLAQFPAPVLAATAICTLVVALLRLKTTSLAGLISCALLLAAVWPQWFPKAPAAQDGAPVITVYSANLWARNTDVAAMKASIRAADPDIILLVEVGNAPAENLDLLLEGYPHRAMSVPGNITVAPARTLVASRWPIQAVPENPRDRLSAMAAIVQTPLGETGVMAAHLTRPWPYQHQWGQIAQVEDMTSLRPKLGQRAIIAGDFNSVSSARIGRQVKDSMGLSPAPARLGTWPTFLPPPFGITIDQVWHSQQLAVVDRKLGRNNGSDHRPVITRFTAAR